MKKCGGETSQIQTLFAHISITAHQVSDHLIDTLPRLTTFNDNTKSKLNPLQFLILNKSYATFLSYENWANI